MEATKKMVEEGLGIALLPRMAVERELQAGDLREIGITGMPNQARQIALISRRSRPLGPVAQAFVEIVQEMYTQPAPEQALAAAAS
jgi:DNA-binding transcriptional LysR family regulator